MPKYKEAFAFAVEDGHKAAAASVNPEHERGVSIVMEGVPARTKRNAALNEDIATESAI